MKIIPDSFTEAKASKALLAISVVLTFFFIALYYLINNLDYLPAGSLEATVASLLVSVGIIEAVARIIYYFLINSVNKAEAKTLAELFRILAYVILLFILLNIWKPNITGLLISAGFLGIVFGLAAQSTLSNFISGIYLLATKTIEPNDSVIIHNGSFTFMPQSYPHDKFIPGFPGIVESIGVLYTKLINDDGIPLYVPNSVVASSLIINYHRAKEYTRRIQFDVDLLIPFEKLKKIIDLTMKKNSIKAYNVHIEYLHNNIYVVTIYLKAYEKSTREIKSRIFANILESMPGLKGSIAPVN